MAVGIRCRFGDRCPAAGTVCVQVHHNTRKTGAFNSPRGAVILDAIRLRGHEVGVVRFFPDIVAEVDDGTLTLVVDEIVVAEWER